MKYRDAQYYISTSTQCRATVEEIIDDILKISPRPLYADIWINNLLHVLRMMDAILNSMWQLQKKIVISQNPGYEICQIYLCARNISSLVPLVRDNYQKAIINFDPFIDNETNKDTISNSTEESSIV